MIFLLFFSFSCLAMESSINKYASESRDVPQIITIDIGEAPIQPDANLTPQDIQDIADSYPSCPSYGQGMSSIFGE